MEGFPRRGQIYWVDFSPARGSEQDGRRPAVVVSNNITNQHSTIVTVVPLTSREQKKNYPQNVSLPAGMPLPKAGTVLCAQVRTISQERLEEHRADLSDEQMQKVDRALGKALGLPPFASAA